MGGRDDERESLLTGPWMRPHSGQLPAGRHGLSRDFVAESQRTRVLDALVACVAEQGYPETRVTDLIARSGVSRKTFYELFADKEECFLAAYDAAVTLLMGGVTTAYESEDEWIPAIRAALAAFLDFLAQHPELTRLCIVDVHAAGARALARRDAAVRGFYYFLDAGRGDAPRALPGLTAEAVTGGMYEVIYGRVLRGSTADLPRLLPELVYWALMPFLGHDTAATEMERLREQQANGRSPPVAAAARAAGLQEAVDGEQLVTVPPRRSGRRPKPGDSGA
ncbi:TetR/AcrR family transcriptional regulator [Conexibacter sp. JD483]|uniref:TetR/AcrR family transcriptional regulator n=1 Tax=unclassified Conexibacter TaxID=2627773 RepID=UPI0027193C2A|nr:MULTISPECIES: TetR/AcrR family transcriptional regulator [unclassified Conexibacter]MDO8189240.1 TetR/AcrR family transcriptional regulator [Conexibacter sp. CPCC 205706]MDO8198726.1 TetR/AcrR family transcriptional regulator [Conexibacter sp. CPCC 205762]MDR9372113.1 TetR/AcrR family transcriptional regulator [Conexibacter sp. JD483]